MLDLKEFYAPDRIGGTPWAAWSRFYSICAVDPDDLSKGGYHCGVDIPARGDVPALLGGRVVRVRLSPLLGSIVVIESEWQGRTVYVSYCHLSKLDLPSEGERIGQGERVGTLATGNPRGSIFHWDFPGTAWTGPHLHQVVGGHPDSAYSMVVGHRILGAFTDPRIIQRAVLAAPTGAGASSTTDKGSPARRKGPNMAEQIRVNKHIFTVAPGQIAHAPAKSNVDVVRNVLSTADERHELTAAQALDVLDALGIPRLVVDLTGGRVLNPTNGKHEAGGFWSWERHALAGGKKI